MIRTNDHFKLVHNKYSNLPVINGLSNISHPCQILLTLWLTMKKEALQKIKNLLG